MLFIIHIIILTIWFMRVVKKGEYTWGTILTAFFVFVLIVDIGEMIFNFLLNFYKFPAHLLSDFNKDNQLGVLLADVVTLPLTLIIVCHYLTHSNKRWLLVILFTIMQGLTEVLYIRLGYLVYLHWNIWISISVYFVGLCIFSKYAPHFLRKEKPLPYPIILTASVYNIAGMLGGAIMGGELLNLFEWRPHIFNSPHADDRFSEIGSLTLLGILTGTLIPKFNSKHRPIVFGLLSLVGISYYTFANWKGWLLYNNWNVYLTIIRWIVPFAIIAWLDRQESFRT
ncbi:hypothetical protein FS935_00345 [Metabacillus litoralis]|uniref:Uncharacterized protein n=1 Tax=Metabacillus litoralis TaxID=152268 RepID=A0A5C6W440_9BACI|nr:hypothetical protein [Metabacillus litoralis]TXC92696.1 hypothetical protein FS935_00345 [Metabacillus litoralis]